MSKYDQYPDCTVYTMQQRTEEWHDIRQDPVIVGRNAACQVVIDDPKISAVFDRLFGEGLG